MVNDTVNEHVYTVNKRVSIREATGVNSKELRSEIMNRTLPHRRWLFPCQLLRPEPPLDWQVSA